MTEPRRSLRHQGAASPASAGTNVTVPAVGDGGADRVEVGGAGDHSEVGEPPDSGRGGVHLPVEAVAGTSAELPGDTADQPGGAAAWRGPGLGEEEGAGAVGAFGGARLQGALGEEGGLLVDEQSGQREFTAEDARRTDGPGGVDDGREPLIGEAEDVQGGG